MMFLARQATILVIFARFLSLTLAIPLLSQTPNPGLSTPLSSGRTCSQIACPSQDLEGDRFCERYNTGCYFCGGRPRSPSFHTCGGDWRLESENTTKATKNRTAQTARQGTPAKLQLPYSFTSGQSCGHIVCPGDNEAGDGFCESVNTGCDMCGYNMVLGMNVCRGMWQPRVTINHDKKGTTKNGTIDVSPKQNRPQLPSNLIPSRRHLRV